LSSHLYLALFYNTDGFKATLKR